MPSLILTRHADVLGVLADPSFLVPPPQAGPMGGVAWLRSTVARFSSGGTHARRRALAVAALDGIDVDAVRDEARSRTATILQEPGPVDVMARIARAVPVRVLADALGLPHVAVADVASVAVAYPGAGAADPRADRACAALVDACGRVGDADRAEAVAARIGLLVQTCEATAGLVGHAVLVAVGDRPGDSAETLVTETLRHDPPVRATRRLAPAGSRLGVPAGTEIGLDLAAANRDPAVFPDPDRFDPTRAGSGRHLGFGAGPHACPGREHAAAIVAGILDALTGHRLVAHVRGDAPTAVLRVPSVVLVTRR